MSLFHQYKPFFLFLLRFFGVYALLSIAYRWYLSRFDVSRFETDGATWWVARQTKALLEIFGRQSALEPHPDQPSVKLFLDGHYVARVVEGCNGISVMILFVAFVIAFRGKWLATSLYILSGLLVIHLLNIVRIALLAMALLEFPQSEELLHGVVFPAVIYGTVLLLWVIWVNKFAKHGGR